MSTDLGTTLRDLVVQVAGRMLGTTARIQVDLHPSREEEARAALADLPDGFPPVGLQLDELCPPDRVQVRPWWPTSTFVDEPRAVLAELDPEVRELIDRIAAPLPDLPPARPVPAAGPVVTVSPTIGSGTVVRWYGSEAAADAFAELVSASRDGVIGGRGQYLDPDLFAAAWRVHLDLKAGRYVGNLATHRREGVFGGPVVPVE